MNRDTRIVACCLAAIALMILGSSFAATLAIAHGAPRMLRLVFRLFCHGIPHRCFTVSGVAMPICARCVGVYGGFLVGIVVFGFWRLLTNGTDGTYGTYGTDGASIGPIRPIRPMVMLAIAVAPLALDGITQLAGLRESTNPLRLVTGLIAGAAFGLWVLVSVETRARQRFAPS